MGTPIYIAEYLPEKGSIISALINAFVPTGYSHTALRVGKILYEVDPTKGKTYNKFDLSENCCDYLMKWGSRIHFYWIGDYDDSTIQKIEIWWDFRLKSQPAFSILRLLTMPFDIARRKIYELQFKLTGRPTQTLFDLLLPNNDTCIAAVDKSLKAAGIDLRPDLSENMSYPGLLSERFRGNKVQFICGSQG